MSRFNTAATSYADPFENLLSHLSNVKRINGHKAKSLCPCHEDTHPSLDITRSETGNVVAFCQSCGANGAAVAVKVGLPPAALFAKPHNGNGSGHPPASKPKAKTIHDSIDRAIDALKWSLQQHAGKLSLANRFRFVGGGMFTLRFHDATGKKHCGAVSRSGDGWIVGDPPKPLPLHVGGGGDELPAGDTVFVFEGEGKADKGQVIGLPSLSSSHGAKSADRHDWSLASGRRVVISIDNDDAGRGFGNDVARLTLAAGAIDARIVCITPEIDGGDIIDLAKQLSDDAELRAAILAATESAPAISPATTPDHDPAPEVQDDFGQDAAMEPADDLAVYGIDPDMPARNVATPSEATDAPNTPDDDLAFLTELENSRRLLRARGDDLRYVPGWGWFHWNGSRWKLDELGIVAEWMKGIIRGMWAQMPHATDRKALARFISESERHSKITAAINLARTDPAVAIMADKMDADPWLIGHPTCVTDLKTGQTRGGRRVDLITKATAVDPAEIPIPLFIAFVNRIFDGNADLIAYVKKLLGMFLTGDITEQAIWFFIGSGSNGKSVLVDLILFILAEYGLLAPPDLLTVRPHGAGHPTDLASLFGVRLAVVSETPSGATMELSRMKALTGDANITARRMRENFVTKTRTHKTALVTNHPLRINDASEAVWRRIQKVPFSVTIPARERDPKLLARLKAEAPGVLHWMIQGCLLWQRDGLQPPAIVLDATQDYKNAETPAGDYIADRLRPTPRAMISRSELFADYQSYCAQIGEKHPMSRAELFAAILAIPDVTKKVWKKIGQNVPIRGFFNIEFASSVAPVADGSTSSHCAAIPNSHEGLTGKSATTCYQMLPTGAKGDGNPELSGDYSMDEVQVRR